eukprot:Platyproteum_vivax@DN7477_c2_g3_i1.p1
MNYLILLLLFACGLVSHGLKISKLKNKLLSRAVENDSVIYMTFGQMVEKTDPRVWLCYDEKTEKTFNRDYKGIITPYGTIALRVSKKFGEQIQDAMMDIMEAVFLKFLTISPKNWLVMRPMVDEGTINNALFGRYLTGKHQMEGWGNLLTEPEIISDIWYIDEKNLAIVNFKEGGHLSYPLYSEAILQVFNRYLSDQLTPQASNGGTFVIFVGAPARIRDSTQWARKKGHEDDSDDASLYYFNGQYMGEYVVAINYSPEVYGDRSVYNYFQNTRTGIVQELTSKLKNLQFSNYKVTAEYVEDGEKLQEGSYVADRLKFGGNIDLEAQVTHEWEIVHLNKELYKSEAYVLYEFPSKHKNTDNIIAEMVKNAFMKSLNGMNPSTFDPKTFLDTESSSHVARLIAKPKLDTTLVATDKLVADRKVTSIHKHPVTKKDAPPPRAYHGHVPYGKDEIVPADDIPKEFLAEARKWAAEHPLSASDMAKNPTPLNYIKIGKVAKALDKEDKSPKRRQVVFDEIEGQFVMKLVENTPLKMEDYKINNWEAKQ